MLSAEDIAAVKTAIEICNNPDLKREILCAPGPDYDGIKRVSSVYDRKVRWNKIVKKKATVILENLGIAKQLEEKVMGTVLLVGMRMLTWAEYIERTLGLSREYSVHFLNSSFFTQQGIIDDEKAAAELMKDDESLNITQRYKLACLYCFTDHIPDLYRQMSNADKEKFYDAESPVRQPQLVKFWSYYLVNRIDTLKGTKDPDKYRLETAVKSGSKAAVEYCLDKTNLKGQKDAIVDAAVEAVKCRISHRPHTSTDRVVFRKRKYKDSGRLWVPSDYYVDILSLLLSKMEEDQQVEFLKKDIKGAEYERGLFEDDERSRVLEYLLNWPYQHYFMKTTKLMWKFLPERDYAVLLLKICDKIECKNPWDLKYGECKSYEYRELLREFWYRSPERYKRHVLSNEEVACRIDRRLKIKTGVALLNILFTLKTFTSLDVENIKLILASATDKEKENIFSSKEWRKFCIRQMKKEKWDVLDRFALNSFSSNEEEDNFKRQLNSTQEAKFECIEFIVNDKWNAAESFIKWSCSSEEDINNLKKEIIYSDDGLDACADLISNKKIKAADKFIRWCFSSEDEIKAFRKDFAFSHWGTNECVRFALEDQLEDFGEFMNFCISHEEDVREFKKKVAYTYGCFVCRKLISEYLEGEIFNGHVTSVEFIGGKWVEVEKFLTWCFSSEEEITDFKKNVLLKESGKDIHFNLIRSNQWEEAETFFAWLGLSAEEIKDLKKETLFNHYKASEMFNQLVYDQDYHEEFADFGNRNEAIELLLRWYLSDRRTVLEFKGKYRECVNVEDTGVLEYFDRMIEQRLRDLDEEKIGVKRKSETSSDNKRFRNLELENVGAGYGEGDSTSGN